MKIVFAADTYKPYISGVTMYLSQHMAELKRQGHDASLVTFGKKGDPVEEGVIINPGIRLKIGFSVGLRYTPATLDALRSADVIHMHHPFLTGQLVLNAVRGRNIPLVCTMHTRYDQLINYDMPWLPKNIRGRLLGMYLPAFCQKIDRVICNSAASEQGLRNCGVRGEVIRIPNGIELGPFLSAKANPTLRRQMGGEGKTLFVYIGRLSPEKNLPLLLEAFARSLQKGCRAHLAMIGGGPSAAALKQIAEQLGISDSITFTGKLPSEELPAYYASADTFVMPSIHDTHPLAVLEAMAAGLSILAVKSLAYADTVFEGKNGLLVENKPDALASALAYLSVNEPARSGMGLSSREIVKTFSIEKSVDRLLEVYRSLIEVRPDNFHP
jgi:glycosyltransferase involved in cell wall biosynthesis